jgi:sporulation protein YlmC with PRC-barrel domain
MLDPMDSGHAVHYTAVKRGTAVYSSDGVQVGTVDDVLDNYREHILDGIVIETPGGELRFVDGPEVERTFERAVSLTIDAEEAAALPEPEKAPPRFTPRRTRNRISRLLGGGWRRQ